MKLVSKTQVFHFIFALLILYSYHTFSQETSNITDKIQEYISKADQSEATHPDSAICYYKITVTQCDSLLRANNNLIHILLSKAYALQQLGWCYGYYKSDFNAGSNYSQKAIEIYQSLEKEKNIEIVNKSQKGIATCLSDMGVSLYYIGNNSKALEYYHKSLKKYEELESSKDNSLKKIGKNGLSKCYTNIGLVYTNLFKYDLALEYFLKSEKIDSELNDSTGLKDNYINIGLVYSKLKKFDKSNIYYLKSLKKAEEDNNLREMSSCYNNIGSNYKQTKDYKKAIKFYRKSLELDTKLGDKLGIAINNNNLSSLLILTNDYNNAIFYANQALKYAIEINANLTKYYSYGYLFNTYDSLGDYKNALKFHKLFKETNDSLFNETSSRQIKEMEAQYQSEKKQLEIDNLTKSKALKDIELERQQNEVEKQSIIIFSFLLGFVIVVIYSVILYRQSKAKKKANTLLAKQNIEIQMKNEEIESQRDEIEAQRDLVLTQKNEIEEIHNELTSSIRYAERIQHAILPSDDLAKMFLANHFIFYKPRDIVSGDFYWTIIKKNWLLVAVADCTGHGVPGAFMSMLGTSYLNEIFAQSDFTSTSEVLGKLRSYIIKSLHQKGIEYEHSFPSVSQNQVNMKDGMDISLVAIDLENYHMQFSGANNPVYIVKKFIKPESEKVESEKTVENSFQLDELKGDKMPIAIHVRMDEFSLQEYKLKRGDTIYMFSDGFADQFGGPDGKKFMYKRLKELFLSINTNPMSKQKEIIEKELSEWIGKGEQIDDVTVIGIKI